MCVCVCVCVYVCARAYACIHACVRACMYVESMSHVDACVSQRSRTWKMSYDIYIYIKAKKIVCKHHPVMSLEVNQIN